MRTFVFMNTSLGELKKEKKKYIQQKFDLVNRIYSYVVKCLYFNPAFRAG